MELARGEDLSERLRRGPISADEVTGIATQIAHALEAAHEQGIVHRDLKPANIKVDEEGRVTILDFGLAKAFESDEVSGDFANSPTMVQAATHAGIVLGTAGYMSPEQARGKRVDKRADIWAFGVVVWEMLTGERLFGGDTISDTLAAVLTRDADLGKLPAGTPLSLRWVLERCLERDLRKRLHDIADARIELENANQPAADHVATAPAPSSRLPWIVAALAVAVAVVAAGTLLLKRTSTPANDAIYLRLPLEPAARLSANGSVTISPDGRTLLMLGSVDGRANLLARALTSPESTVVPGSEDANLGGFSPDGSRIIFGARGTVWKAPISGGDPTAIAQAASQYGFCWCSGGSIVFSTGWGAGLVRVPERGGAPVPLTKPVPGGSDLWPACLPDGKHVLFTRWSVTETSLHLVTVASGDVTEILRNGQDAKFLPPGVLTFVRGSSLMAVRFDPERLAVEGEPVLLGVKVYTNIGTLGASYDLSTNGTLVYLPASSAPDPKAFWVDLKGNEVGAIDPHLRLWSYPQISPDGSKLLAVEWGPAFQIWIIDLQGGPRLQFTNGGDNPFGIWAPNGDIIYTSNRHGRYEILRQPADGTGEATVLAGGQYPDPQGVSPDGRYLLFSDSRSGNEDLFVLDLHGGEPSAFVSTPGTDRRAAFSPDGEYVAYQSNVSGRHEIYVTPFPGPGRSWQISTGGGLNPVWAPDGRALYLNDESKEVMRVATSLGGAFSAGRPERLFTRPFFDDNAGHNMAISRDGTKLIFRQAEDTTPFERLNIVLNFETVLDAKLQAGP